MGQSWGQVTAPSILATADRMGADAPSLSSTVPRAPVFCLRPGQRQGSGKAWACPHPMLHALGHDTGPFPLCERVPFGGTPVHCLHPGWLAGFPSLALPPIAPSPQRNGVQETGPSLGRAKEKSQEPEFPEDDGARAAWVPPNAVCFAFCHLVSKGTGGGWCAARLCPGTAPSVLPPYPRQSSPLCPISAWLSRCPGPASPDLLSFLHCTP